MAWGAKARNNSAKARGVNYHEDEGGGGGGNGGGGRNPLTTTAILAVLGLTLINAGGQAVSNGISSIKESFNEKRIEKEEKRENDKDFVNKIKKAFGKEDPVKEEKNFAEKLKEKIGIKETNKKKTSKTSKTSKKAEKLKDTNFSKVKNSAGIDKNDMEHVLLFLHNEWVNADNPVSDREDIEVVIVDYDCFDNERKYNKYIIDELYDYSEAVTFLAVNSEYLEEEEMYEEFDRVSEMIDENRNVDTGAFTSIQTNGLIHVPEDGSFVMAITFME